MTFPPNTLLGHYVILSKLGAGGMGEVYLARDPRLDRKVAIKVLLPAFATDSERLTRFELETKSLALLNHPNILQIYDTGFHEGSPFIVMEFLEGESLRQRMDGRPIPPRKAVEIACQITKGLAAAHEKGITHRDLKPENIFLVDGDTVKVLDFGLAKFQGPPAEDSDVTQQAIAATPCLTQPGIVVGTVGYLSPEQVVGRPADPRSDIFAVGVVLWEMLRGSRPFHRDSAVETMHAILKEDLPDLGDTSGIPPGLSRIVHRCLEKNPRARFQNAQDLAFHLEDLTLTTATQPTVNQRVVGAGKGFRWGWMGVGAGFLLLAAGAFWMGRSTRSIQPVQFQRITYQRGVMERGRFGPDGMTFVYAVSRDGAPSELWSGRADGVGSTALGFPAGTLILSISRSGEMALLLGVDENGVGTLAKASMGGGAPREILEGVVDADWSPDGKSLMILRKGPEGRMRIEYPLGKVLYEAPESHLIFFPRLSPQGDRIAFSVSNSVRSGELRVMDLEGQSRVLVAGRCESLAWTPGGDEILFSALPKLDRHELRRVDLAGRQRTVYSSLGSLSVHDISVQGRVMVDQTLVQNGIRLKGPGDKVERDLSWLHSSDLADLSEDGKQLLILELREGSGPGGAYIRKTDGSAAVRLGDGDPLVLSPDGRWALVRSFDQGQELVLLPTGAGEPRRLPAQGLISDWALFMRKGPQILMAGAGSDKQFGCYLQDISSGAFHRLSWEVTPEAYAVLAPDGDRVALGPMDGRIDICSVKSGRLRSHANVPPQEMLVQWSQDGRYLYSADLSQAPAKVYRVGVEDARRTLWKELAPEGVARGTKLQYLSITPDGRSYAYSFRQTLTSDLYLMDSWQ